MSSFEFEFESTNPVEIALAAALADPEQIPVFLDALSAGRVQVPVTELPDEDGRVSFPSFESGGEAYIAAYTSEAAIQRAGRGEQPRIELTGRDLAIMWPAGASMAINPGAGADIALPATAIDALRTDADGVANRRIPAGTHVTVGVPPVEPEELLGRLGEVAAGWPAIRSLHRALVVFDESGDPPQILIGVEVSPAAPNLESALAALAQAAGTDAGLVPLRPDAEDPINRFMRRQDSPFYRAPG